MAKENKTIYAILGLLSHEELSGYDIKKRIDQTLCFFWNTGFGQIYPTLKQLEKEGFVTKKTEKNENRPNRIVYTITESGRKELERWVTSPVETEFVRYEILLKLFFGKMLSREENIKVIEEFKRRYSEPMQTLERYKEKLGEILQADEDHLYYYLTVLFGEKVYKAYMDWADEAAGLLNKIRG